MARQRKTSAARVDVHKNRRHEVIYASPAEQPPADRRWHPRARRWYEQLARSPQSVHYHLSDWNLAWFAALNLSDWLKLDQGGRLNRIPQLFMQSQRKLMTTHMDRLNGRIEVEAPPDAFVQEAAESAAENVLSLQNRFA